MNDLSLKIKASLNEGASKQQIQTQLAKLQKQLSLKINLTGLSESIKTSHQDLLALEKDVLRINAATYDASIKPLKDALTVSKEIESKLTEISKTTFNAVSQSVQGSLNSASGGAPSKDQSKHKSPAAMLVESAGTVNSVIDTYKNIDGLLKVLKELNTATVECVVPLDSLTVAFSIADTSLEALTMTMLKSPLFGVVAGTIAIITLIEAIDYLSNSFERQHEKVKELSSTLNDLKSAYEVLSSKSDLTEAEEKRLRYYEAQIAANEIILQQEAKKEYLEKKKSDGITNTAVKGITTRFGTSGLDHDQKINVEDSLESQINQYETLSTRLDDVAQQQIKNAENIKKSNDKLNNLPYTESFVFPTIKHNLLTYEADRLAKEKDALEKNLTDLIAKTKDSFELYENFDLYGVLSDEDKKRFELLSKYYAEYIAKINATKKETTESGTATSAYTLKLEELATQFRSGNITMDEYIAELSQLKASSKDYKTEIYNLGKAHEYLTSISERVSDSHSLTKDEVNQLVAFYPGLQGAIYQTADGWMVEKEAVDLLNEGVGDLRDAYIDAQTSMLRTAAINAAERLGISLDELEGIENVADAYRLLSGSKEGMVKKAMSSIAMPFIPNEIWKNVISNTFSPDAYDVIQYAKFKESTKNLRDNIGSKYNVNALNNKRGGNSASNSAANASTISPTPISPVDTTKATVDAINQQSKINEKRVEQLKYAVELSKESDKYIDQINVENALLTDQVDLLETIRFYKNSSYDGQISSQSQLLSTLIKSAEDLEIAKEKLHQEANNIRAKTEFDTESWFNPDGSESLAYLELLNSYAGKTDDTSNQIRENIRTTWGYLSTCKDSWQENNDKVKDLNRSIADTKNQIEELIHVQKIMNLEFQQKELETQEKLYQRALSAVNKTIDQKIDKLKEEKKAIQDANKASEEALQLEQLQESLANAKKQKTVRIYSEAEGWHWEADQNAVKEAEKKIEDFKIQQQLDAIDKQIEGWENYKKEWNDTVNAYNDEQDRLIANQILGRDWEQGILDQRIESVTAFRDEYVAILKEIEEVQNSILSEQKSMAQKVSGSGSGSSSGGKTVKVGSDGNAPAGTNVGDKVVTNNGKDTYQVVGKGDTSKTTGGTYNPASGLTSKKVVYDTGGELNPGGEAINLSGKPEQILSPEQTRAFHFMMVSVPPMLSDLISLKSELNTGFLKSPQSISDNSSHLTIQSMTVQSNNSTDFMQQMQNLVAITGNSRR